MIVTIALASWAVAAFALCWANHRFHVLRDADPDATWLDPWPADEPVRRITTLPPVPPRSPLPDESPLDLTGFALDAAFFSVLAPSFREYQ